MAHDPIDMSEFVGRTNTFSHGYAGASMNVHTMQPHEIGDPGMIVGIKSPHTSTIWGKKYSEQRGNNQRTKMLSDPAVQSDPHAVMGTWTRGPEGAEPKPTRSTTTDRGVHVNTGDHVADMEKSMIQGRRGGEKAIFNLRDGNDIKTNSRENFAKSRINATVHPDRTSAFTKPNPLFGE